MVLWVFRLFFFEKKIQISYKGIPDSGVKKGWIILENMSELGNLHNLDLQVPEHSQNQVSCSFPACWTRHGLPTALLPTWSPTEVEIRHQHWHPHGAEIKHLHRHPHGWRPVEHRAPSLLITANWEPTASQDSQGMETFLEIQSCQPLPKETRG